MKNRLELFRSQIAAFDGAADPMSAISKGYFIEEPQQSSTNALFKRISLRPQSKILLIGGIGSGKTGLDRVDETDKFTRMAVSDLQTSKIGFTIIGATSLLYGSFISSMDNIFNHVEYRSAFDVEWDEYARAFFERVLITRSGQDFFQKDALQNLISCSGGVLRDLINLTQESIQEAYLADSNIIAQEHVEKAIFSLGRAKMLGLNSEQSATLRNLTNRVSASQKVS